MSPRIGLQLYTLREACAADLFGTLEAVAAMGYEGVELYDLCGHPARDVRARLDELGLAVAGRHAMLPALESELPALAAELGELGTDRVALAWAEAESLVDRVAVAAEEAARLGLRLGVHNHWWEFDRLDDGSTLLEQLAALPVWLEIDLGWTWVAGVDPVELLARYAGRSPLVHVKDFRTREGREYCPVGDGAVGYERVIPAAIDAGVEWLLVEQDETDGDAFEDVERSLAAVRGMLAAEAV
ncbi:MAG TPA: sugar phosphate isomerase/epimerase [Gaiellaceae bacterium]